MQESLLKILSKKSVLIELNTIFVAVRKHGNSARHFEAYFGFEPNLYVPTNVKVTLSKNRARIVLESCKYSMEHYSCVVRFVLVTGNSETAERHTLYSKHGENSHFLATMFDSYFAPQLHFVIEENAYCW